jgi:prophage regulatory protein
MTTSTTTPPRKLIRRDVVLDRCGVSNASQWRMEKRGEFPARVKLTGTLVGWYEDEVEAWINTRQRGSGRRGTWLSSPSSAGAQ